MRQVKKKEITVPAQESIMKEGWKPDQFRSILQKAIGKLRGFIQFMKEIRNGEFDARGNPLIRHDLRFDVTPAPLPESAKGERPSSALQEAEVMRLDRILQKIRKQSRKFMPLKKQSSGSGKRSEGSSEKVVSWEREERTGAKDHRKTTGTEDGSGDFKRDSQNAGI